MTTRRKRQKVTVPASAGELVGDAIQELSGALIQRTTDILVDGIQEFTPPHRSACFARNQIRETFAPAKHTYPRPTARDQSSSFVEVDEVYPDDSSLSVGTIIKRACLKHYDDYKTLDENEQHLVDLGANGILDLGFGSAQKDLFSESGWRSLLQRFSKRFDSKNPVLEVNDRKLKEIEMLAKATPCEARALAGKMESTHRGASSTLFDLYYEYLKVLEFKKYVFRKDIDITEADVTVKIWGPLLESMMRDKADLRLKWGDSIGDSGSVSKAGFKVDVRLVQDIVSKVNNRKEQDAANVEIARLDAPIGKIDSDRCKLFLESKCVIDRLVQVTGDCNMIVCGLQLAGRKITLYSTAIESNGLYVAMKEESATLPATEVDLPDLRKVYQVLSMFRTAATATADITLRNHPPHPSASTNVSYTRHTWLPPRGNHHVPHLPQYFYS
ncbi:hypothetical protein DFQ28_008947 [Apophysomyces sp. BC1034]|nr:hypothetical protein DFQ30_008921 [Apophysomyces sp. BC1015]KAG0173465.1 hypothetical protein DFQ29_007947 [Apophysomyces sp. BC1021]KAG0185696.1 hypothetical protein DFQ28_008947 [Apophysomyces sp. BC1034]